MSVEEHIYYYDDDDAAAAVAAAPEPEDLTSATGAGDTDDDVASGPFRFCCFHFILNCFLC
jgi:hypothetical protein